MPAPQRSIRIPDELAEVIEAEAERLDRSFSWVVVNRLRASFAEPTATPAELAEIRERWTREHGGSNGGLGKGYAPPRPKGGKR